MNKIEGSPQYIQSTINVSGLAGIVANKSNVHDPSTDFEKVTALVTLAAASVLENPVPYLKGEQAITPKQYEQISAKFEHIRSKVHEQAAKEQAKLERKSNLMNYMLTRLRGLNVDLKDEHARNSLMTDFYQVMGCVASYRQWNKGDLIEGPHPNLPNYKVERVIANQKGLQIVVLVPFPAPKDKSLPPIFCCRGTTSNPHNLLDDMNKHIGQYSLKESLKDIRKALKVVSKRYGSVIVTGHSLGGAVAQGITAEFCDRQTLTGEPRIKATYHFNAPGVGTTVAEQYKAKIDQLDMERRPKVFAYHHVGDIVSWAGGDHIEATETKEIGEMSLKKLLAPETYIKTVHCWQKTVSEFGEARPLKRTRLLKVTRGVSERIRLFFAAIFKFFVRHNIFKTQTRQEQADVVSDFMSDHLMPLRTVKHIKH